MPYPRLAQAAIVELITDALRPYRVHPGAIGAIVRDLGTCRHLLCGHTCRLGQAGLRRYRVCFGFNDRRRWTFTLSEEAIRPPD